MGHKLWIKVKIFRSNWIVTFDRIEIRFLCWSFMNNQDCLELNIASPRATGRPPRPRYSIGRTVEAEIGTNIHYTSVVFHDYYLVFDIFEIIESWIVAQLTEERKRERKKKQARGERDADCVGAIITVSNEILLYFYTLYAFFFGWLTLSLRDKYWLCVTTHKMHMPTQYNSAPE